MPAWGRGEGRTGSGAHKKWRKKVLDRDGWECVQCGNPTNQADHILPWSTHPHLEFDVSNGQALCHQHHMEKTLQEAARARALKTRHRPPRQHPGA
jgi:5-methylcytosine-specific restriction endonuclease McrA